MEKHVDKWQKLHIGHMFDLCFHRSDAVASRIGKCGIEKTPQQEGDVNMRYHLVAGVLALCCIVFVLGLTEN